MTASALGGFDAFVIGDDEAEHLEDGFTPEAWIICSVGLVDYCSGWEDPGGFLFLQSWVRRDLAQASPSEVCRPRR